MYTLHLFHFSLLNRHYRQIPDVPFLVKYDGIHILWRHTSLGAALGRGTLYLLYTMLACGIDSTDTITENCQGLLPCSPTRLLIIQNYPTTTKW